MNRLARVRVAESLELPPFSVGAQISLKEKFRSHSWESLFKGTVIDFDVMYLVIGDDEFDF
jgi:hypothetical protein